jgi:hypothetical protein
LNKPHKKPLPDSLILEDSSTDALYSEAMDDFEAQEKERKTLHKRSKKRPRVQILAMVFGVLAVVYGVVRLWPAHNDLPNQLLGVWRTESSAYTDRFIEFRYITVSFGTGHATASTGFIRKVEVGYDGNRTLYHVTYAQDGHELRLSFYYDSGEGSIRLKNQQNIVWTKENTSQPVAEARPNPSH